MPAEITMPQLSDTMTEGTLIKWLKKEGDEVDEGDVIAEVETDKANMEMEAFESGTIAHIAAKEGEIVPVGGVLAVLATAGEDPEEVKKQFGQNKAKAPAAEKKEKPPGEKEKKEHRAETAESPEEGRAATRQKATREAPQRAGEPTDRDAPTTVREKSGATATAVKEADGRAGRIRVSPIARRIAEEKGIDLSEIRGSGPGGRIVQRDVLEYQPRKAAKAAPSPKSLPARIPSGERETIALTKMRSVIASRLLQSKQSIPHYYEVIDIDVEQLVQLRARLNEQLEGEGLRLSLGDLIAKGVAVALASHPSLNATFDGREITRYGDVNLGIAVALSEGLIVPVLRGVDQMDLKEIRQRTADLVERARAQKLKQDELTGATFTVSNLGAYGVREFSAIINPPEVAILAIGAAEKRAVIRDGQIVPRSMMSVTLSADHRVVDGAEAAEFLRTLKNLLEVPAMMLV